MRRTALTSLGFVGRHAPDKVLPFLLEMAYDKDPLTRIPAVQALARVGQKAVIPVLMELIKKEQDNSALWFEVSGLYLVGGAEAVKALEELKPTAQEKKNPWFQELVEEALLRLAREKRTL
jgi:HEAT repeat protein